jgi:hypothetical protein
MSRILSIVALALWLSGQATVHAQSPDEVAKQLRKLGVSGYDPFLGERDRWTAGLDGSRPDFVEAARLLRRFKNIEKIRLNLGATKLTEEQAKLIKDLPTVKHLEIVAIQLSGQELQEIASLKHVEDLSLESQEFSAALLKPLHEMKGLKRLWLISANEIPPAAVGDLKNALTEPDQVIAAQVPAIFFFQPLAVAPGDSPIAKLKKEKFNAALAAVRGNERTIMAGGRNSYRSSAPSLEIARVLKEAILDLDDPALRLKAIDGYVDLMKVAEEETRIKLELGAQGVDPETHQIARYHYLDAQLLQLQLRKQAEKK